MSPPTRVRMEAWRRAQNPSRLCGRVVSFNRAEADGPRSYPPPTPRRRGPRRAPVGLARSAVGLLRPRANQCDFPPKLLSLPSTAPLAASPRMAAESVPRAQITRWRRPAIRGRPRQRSAGVASRGPPRRPDLTSWPSHGSGRGLSDRQPGDGRSILAATRRRRVGPFCRPGLSRAARGAVAAMSGAFPEGPRR